MSDNDEVEYGYCNSCGEEAELYGDECCDDGEIVEND